MLAAIRWIFLGIFIVLFGVIGCIFCILRPFHRNNTYVWARIFGSVTRILGVKLEVKVHPDVPPGGPAAPPGIACEAVRNLATRCGHTPCCFLPHVNLRTGGFYSGLLSLYVYV